MAFLTQQWEAGEARWVHLPPWGRAELPPHHAAILTPYTDYLTTAGCARGPRSVYRLVAKQFLRYLDRAQVSSLTVVTLEDVTRFVPAVGAAYQPTSMRTVWSALRHFLAWAPETQSVTEDLTAAAPRSSGRKTVVVPRLAAAKEQWGPRAAPRGCSGPSR